MKKRIETPEQIKAAALLVDPGAVLEGNEWKMLNPTRKDKNRGSFGINATTGRWLDGADQNPKARGNSAAALLMFAKGISHAEAMKLLSKPSTAPVVAPAPAPRPAAARLQAAPKDAPPPTPSPSVGWTHGGSWAYRNEQGLIVMWVLRYDPPADLVAKKVCHPYHWVPGKGWIMGDPPGPLPLYNQDQLAARPDAPVLLCEGEKSADAAAKLFPNHVCITSSHGASGAKKTDFSPAKGRAITISPDNDAPGMGYAEDVTALAYAAGATSVSIVEIPSYWPDGWDLADKPPKGVTLKDLRKLVKAAALVPKPKTLFDLVESATDFVAKPVPPIEFLVGSWLTASSLSMIFAPRGLGKSWFAYWLAICMARGERFFAWPVYRKCRVLYVDGEMTTAHIQKRIRLLAGKQIPAGLDILSSEALWQEGKPLNFNDTSSHQRFQEMLDALAEAGRKPEAIIVDNLSCLTAGKDENSNTDQDGLLQWLMGLRHQGYAVPMLHHSGKNGEQRGASRREDWLDTVIRLDEPKNLPEPAKGACFTISFTKYREEQPDPFALTVQLGSSSNGMAEWKIIQPLSDTACLIEAIHNHPDASQNTIAGIAGISTGGIKAKLADLVKRGLLDMTIKGNKHTYTVTNAGFAEITPSSRKYSS